ncbi:MAG TPA: glycosyltransferase family 9 protein [Candidatus Paceibacterota bacterium]|nr:glycosyltransferase family 9 protein [Candidatus Paceibacterota bacterium]
MRDTLLCFRPQKVNTGGWGERLLVINMNALGDLALFTSVLKHYKQSFPGKKIYLLLRADLGIGKKELGGFVDEVIAVDHRKFGRDPFYAASFMSRLRKIGFYKVADQGPSASELIARIISVRLGAKEVYGYEGFGIQYQIPIDRSMKDAIRFCQKNIFPRYTRLIPSIDKNANLRPLLHNYIRHLIAIYEGAGGAPSDDYATELPVDPVARERVEKLLLDNGISPGTYCALTLGASSATRRWPVERFAEAAEELKKSGIPIVLMGTAGESGLAARFHELYSGTMIDLTGKLSLSELIALIDRSLFVFTNDTGPVHIAVARKTPSLCIVGAANPGMLSLYGYRGMNRWVSGPDAPCFFDNWRCAVDPPGGLSPCIDGVTVAAVRGELVDLLVLIRDEKGKKRENLPAVFSIEFR